LGQILGSNSAPSPSSEDYKAAIEAIITGPYMNRLEQYRIKRQGKLIYSEINDTTDPINRYTDDDIVRMLNDRINIPINIIT